MTVPTTNIEQNEKAVWISIEAPQFPPVPIGWMRVEVIIEDIDGCGNVLVRLIDRKVIRSAG